MIYRVKNIFKLNLKPKPAIVTKVLHFFTQVHHNMPDGTHHLKYIKLCANFNF